MKPRTFTTRAGLALAVAVAIGAEVAVPASASPTCTISWDGGAGTSRWKEAINWDADRVPAAADRVCIRAPDVTVDLDSNATVLQLTNEATLRHLAGTLSLTDPGAPSALGPFELRGGTLAGSAPRTISGNPTWTDGRIDGTGTTSIGPGTTVAIQGPDDIVVDNATLVNDGTMTLDADLTAGVDGGAFINNGRIVKPASTSVTLLTVLFDNHGLVDNEGGNLVFARGSTPGAADSGTYATAAGATTSFDGADGSIRRLASGMATRGAGTVDVIGGSLAGTISAEASIVVEPALVEVSEPLTIAGLLQLVDGASLLVGPGVQVVNDGRVEFLGGATVIGATAEMVNFGTITKVASTAAGFVEVLFDNHGLVENHVGALAFAFGNTAGNLDTGTYATFAGSLTVFDSRYRANPRVFGPGSALAGDGDIAFSHGRTILLPQTSLQATNLTVGSLATLDITLAGTVPSGEYPQFLLGGSATLVGTLEVSRHAGFCPAPSDKFRVVSAAATTGHFRTVISPPNGPLFHAVYSEGDVTLSTRAETCREPSAAELRGVR